MQLTTKKKWILVTINVLAAIMVIYAFVKLLLNKEYLVENSINMLANLEVFVRYEVFLFVAIFMTAYFKLVSKFKYAMAIILAEYAIYLMLGMSILGMSGKFYGELVVQFIFYTLLYVLLPSVTAYLGGMMCAEFRNNIVSCMCALIFLYVFCLNGMEDILIWPFVHNNTDLTTAIMRYSLYFDKISISMREFVSTNSYHPFAISLTDMMMMISRMMCVVAVLLLYRRKKLGIVALMLFGVCTAVAFIPRNENFVLMQAVTEQSLKVNDSWNAEKNYYSDKDIEVISEEFKVSHYNITLWPGERMKAQVEVCVDKANLVEYTFTLHHNYKIKSIKDGEGNKLDFEVASDYVTIYNQGKNLEKIVFEYSGYGLIYMASNDYTYLPEYYKYYPVPGRQKVYDVSTENYIKNTLDYEVDFGVKINSNKKYYSNLELIGDNEFEGKCTGVTLLSGMCVGSVDVDGVNIIYPKLQYTEKQIVDSYSELKREFEGNVNGEIRGKKWIVSNYEASSYVNYFNGSNYFTGSFEEVKWYMSGNYY